MTQAGSHYPADRLSAGMMPLLDAPPSLPLDVQADEVEFQQLLGRHDIGQILHLREELRLPASALGDSSFMTREKKETKSAWLADFSGMASSSVPSAFCR